MSQEAQANDTAAAAATVPPVNQQQQRTTWLIKDALLSPRQVAPCNPAEPTTTATPSPQSSGTRVSTAMLAEALDKWIIPTMDYVNQLVHSAASPPAGGAPGTPGLQPLSSEEWQCFVPSDGVHIQNETTEMFARLVAMRTARTELDRGTLAFSRADVHTNAVLLYQLGIHRVPVDHQGVPTYVQVPMELAELAFDSLYVCHAAPPAYGAPGVVGIADAFAVLNAFAHLIITSPSAFDKIRRLTIHGNAVGWARSSAPTMIDDACIFLLERVLHAMDQRAALPELDTLVISDVSFVLDQRNAIGALVAMLTYLNNVAKRRLSVAFRACRFMWDDYMRLEVISRCCDVALLACDVGRRGIESDPNFVRFSLQRLVPRVSLNHVMLANVIAEGGQSVGRVTCCACACNVAIGSNVIALPCGHTLHAVCGGRDTGDANHFGPDGLRKCPVCFLATHLCTGTDYVLEPPVASAVPQRLIQVDPATLLSSPPPPPPPSSSEQSQTRRCVPPTCHPPHNAQHQERRFVNNWNGTPVVVNH